MGIFRFLRGFAQLSAVGWFFGSAAFAGVVTLRSHDQSITITGELLSFDGASYVLQAAPGALSLDAALVSCEGAACPVPVDETRFTISGSSVFGQGLMPVLLEYFALMRGLEISRTPGPGPNTEVFSLTARDGQPYVDITVLSNGASRVFDGLMNGSTTIGMLPAPLEITQRQALQAALGPVANIPTEYAVALDGLAFIVSRKNAIKALSMDEISGIYAGQIRNWAQLGGPDHAINIYMLDRNMGEGSYFTEMFLSARGLEYGQGIQELPDTASLNSSITTDPFGIAVTSVGNVHGARVLSIRGECGILSRPDAFAVAAGDYPFSNRLYLVDSGVARSVAAQDFVDFLRTDAAQAAVYSAGFVDDRIDTQPLDAQGGRMMNMILSEQERAGYSAIRQLAGELQHARRISTTFRFQYGYADFDARSSQDLEKLAAYFRQMDMTGREVLVIGFTDSEGTAGTNTTLSRRRADFVASELQKALGNALGEGANPVRVVARGYGEASPLVCNNTARGRDINRRVEIWIRNRP